MLTTKIHSFPPVQNSFWKSCGPQKVVLGYQPFSHKDPLEMVVGSYKIQVRTPEGKAAEKSEAVKGSPGGEPGREWEEEEEPVALQTHRLQMRKLGCWGAAL